MSAHGGRSFRWLERGDGEPIVLLHGLMGEMRHWEDVLVALESECRPMALHLPLVDPAVPACAIPDWADYVVRFMDALDLPDAVVGGNSLGGHVAIELALTRPDRVSGLILTGSSGLFERGMTRGVPHRPSPTYVRRMMEEVFFDPTLVTPESVERIWRILAARDLAHRVVRVAGAARRHNVEDALPGLSVPTLIVWGKNDRVTPRHVAGRFHELIPGSHLVWMPDCGHAPMLEQPQAFAAILRDWLHVTRERRARLVPIGGSR